MGRRGLTISERNDNNNNGVRKKMKKLKHGKMSQLPKFNSKGVGCQLLMEVMGRERERERVIVKRGKEKKRGEN